MIKKYAITKNRTGEKNVPHLRATAGERETCVLTIPIPMREQNRPKVARESGKNIKLSFPIVAAIAMDAIIAPQ